MAAKTSKVELVEDILYRPTGVYHSAGTVLELSKEECARLIGLGVAVSTDGSVTASEPEPEEPERERGRHEVVVGPTILHRIRASVSSIRPASALKQHGRTTDRLSSSAFCRSARASAAS